MAGASRSAGRRLYIAGLLAAALSSPSAGAVTYSVTIHGMAKGTVSFVERERVVAACQKASYDQPAICSVDLPSKAALEARITTENATIDAVAGTGDLASCSSQNQSSHACTVAVSQPSSLAVTMNRRLPIVVSTVGEGVGEVVVTAADQSVILRCPAPSRQGCSGQALWNQVITFTPQAAPGSRFFSFVSATGDALPCANTASVCTVTVTTRTNLTASFESDNRLSLAAAGTGSGRIHFTTPNGVQTSVAVPYVTSYIYPLNTYIRLTAAQDSGTVFRGWQIASGTLPPGSCNDSTRSCAFALNGPVFIRATFSTP